MGFFTNTGGGGGGGASTRIAERFGPKPIESKAKGASAPEVVIQQEVIDEDNEIVKGIRSSVNTLRNEIEDRTKSTVQVISDVRGSIMREVFEQRQKLDDQKNRIKNLEKQMEALHSVSANQGALLKTINNSINVLCAEFEEMTRPKPEAPKKPGMLAVIKGMFTSKEDKE